MNAQFQTPSCSALLSMGSPQLSAFTTFCNSWLWRSWSKRDRAGFNSRCSELVQLCGLFATLRGTTGSVFPGRSSRTPSCCAIQRPNPRQTAPSQRGLLQPGAGCKSFVFCLEPGCQLSLVLHQPFEKKRPKAFIFCSLSVAVGPTQSLTLRCRCQRYYKIGESKNPTNSGVPKVLLTSGVSVSFRLLPNLFRAL